MSLFVLYDPYNGGYVTQKWHPADSDGVARERMGTWDEARQWKSLRGARTEGERRNLSRNIPPNHSAESRYFRDVPNVVVHEINPETGTVIETFQCPPTYINIEL